MAEEQHVKHEKVEVHDRGLFDFTDHKNKEEEHRNQEDAISTGVEKIHLSEQQKKHDEEKQHDGLLGKLHRSGSSSSSSSSSDEEEEVNGEKKRKKKSLADKLKEKFGHDEKEKENSGEENKSFFEKIKEKVLPSPKKPTSDHNEFATPPPTPTIMDHNYNHVKDELSNNGESKGIFGKIIKKLPGYNKRDGNDEEAENAGVHR